MFSSWLISLASACFQVSILMGYNVETTPVPRIEDAPLLDSTQNSKTNYSGSDIDYEVYAYYLPFLKEQNVSNEEADYSYYENDYLSYDSYDKSVDDENNQNHLPKNDAGLIDKETDATTNSYQDGTELKSLPKTVDGLLTTKIIVTTNKLQNAPERKKQSTMPTVKDDATFLTEGRYVLDDSLQDVTEPYSPENDGSKFIYEGIDVTESSLKDVTEPGSLSKTGLLTKRTDATINYLQDAVESSILNETKYSGAKELDVWNICLRPVEEGSSSIMLFPCSSFEIQVACIGVDHRIEACSEISEVKGAPRRICVKKENTPYVVACNDPFSEAFCFESSTKVKIIPCQDDVKRVCLFEKGHLEICSAVGHDKPPF